MDTLNELFSTPMGEQVLDLRGIECRANAVATPLMDGLTLLLIARHGLGDSIYQTSHDKWCAHAG
jgi:hypothetical protein